MTHSLNAPQDELIAIADLRGEYPAIPASLKAEYQELALKRQQLRAKLERAKAELATLKAKGKAL
jgi:hypothetical protein